MPATANLPHPTLVPPASLGGPVLVASDGREALSDSLFAAARCATTAFGGEIALVGVCEPLPTVSGGGEVIPISIELDESRRQTLQDDLHRIASTAAFGDPRWPVDVRIGSPARTLAHEAEHRGASVLIMGIGRHNPLDRIFGTETTLATLRESSVPVLAVGNNFPAALQQVVVGLDFSVASVQAAQLALRLLGGSGRLSLVHVRPRFAHPSSDWQQWDADYSRTLPPLFDQVRHDLDVPPGVVIETATVRGDPAPALMAYAQQVNADLIAVGTQRHSLFERLMVGSVATRVLRTARRSVLAVPAVRTPAG